MAQATASDKKAICLWTLPLSPKPVVRVEVDGVSIRAQNLFEIGCDALGLCVKSRPFFGLFRGTDYPTKKYGTEESIYVPCKNRLTIQRWSFDLTAEIAAIKTDAVAFRMIALQIISEIESGKMKVSKEEMKELKDRYDPDFVCYRQFVEKARNLPSYSTLVISEVQVVNEAKLRKTTITEGTIVNLVLNSRKMMLISDSLELSIPWRKIRQFKEIKGAKTINLEIFLAEEKSFTWVELFSDQGPLLLQAMVELIQMIRIKAEKPMFRQPNWVARPKVNKLSWRMMKAELFGIGKEKEHERFETFDSIDCISSSSSENEEEEDDEDEDKEHSASYLSLNG